MIHYSWELSFVDRIKIKKPQTLFCGSPEKVQQELYSPQVNLPVPKKEIGWATKHWKILFYLPTTEANKFDWNESSTPEGDQNRWIILIHLFP
jgi:hypothetical protein